MSGSQKVRVYGHVFTIKSDREPGFTQEVAQVVDKRMRETAGANKNSTTEQIAVLTALNMAGQLLEERRKNEAILNKLTAMRKVVEAEIQKDE